MSKEQCSSCSFWKPITDNLHGKDGKPMDTEPTWGGCEKHGKNTSLDFYCDDYEPKSQ